MNKKNKIIVIASVVTFSIIGIFFVSYNISNKNLNGNTEQLEALKKSNSLKDDTKIILKSLDENSKKATIEKEFTVEEFKKDIDVTSSIEKDALIKYYAYSNYDLESDKENEMVFVKKEGNKIVPNKYYIGEKDGYIAIYKSDEKSQLKIEDEKNDIFKDIEKVESLKDDKKESVKSFKYSFDTKEKAEEYISIMAS